MRNYGIGLKCLLATLVVALLIGCGQETVSIPGVLSATPAQGATGVPINTTLTATFSMPMNAASISSSSFTVTGPGGTAVAGTVAYSGTVATFTPTAVLAYGTTYAATITTGAATPGGAALISNYVWTFSTVAASVPSVLSVTPLPFASNVPITGAGATISATFSQAMTAASIGAAGTFTVEAPGGVAVGGSAALSSNGLVATFTPTSGTLAFSTTYTVTITTAAKSLAEGIPLVANYVWSFTTIAANVPGVVSVTPLPLAANVPITGGGATISATFNMAMTAATTDAAFTVAGPGGVPLVGSATLSTNGLVATFTPTSGTLAYSTTYTATIASAATSAGGIPMVANYLWTFTTITPPPTVTVVPVANAIGVPVTQILTATFSEPMDCTTLNPPANNFTLTTGSPAVTVPGTVACLGNVATFTPNNISGLAYNTSYQATITTAAQDPAGQPIPFTQWTFLTAPAPVPLPTVITTSPTTQPAPFPIVGVNSALSATFSEAMTPDTLNSATFLLTVTGGAAVNGVITYAPGSDTATFAPIGGLAYNTTYTATITTGAEDTVGGGLALNYSWQFTSGAPLTPAPTVTSTIPVTPNPPGVPENVTVPVNQVISATFSEAMDPTTIVAANFTLTPLGGASVSGLVAYSGISNELVFIPSGNLLPNTTYNANITTGVQDLAGQPMALAYPWSFKTAAAPSIIAPELLSVIPLSGATGVPLNQAVSGTFSEAMNALTLTSSTFYVYLTSDLTKTPIGGSYRYDPVNFIATFTPTNPLAVSTSYTATVTSGAQDLAGNGLGLLGPIVNNTWTFTTGTTAIVPPVVLGPVIASFGQFTGSAGMTNTGLTTVIHGNAGATAVSYSAFTGFHDNSVLIGGVAECTYTETPANVGLVTGSIYTPLVSTSTFCPLEGTAATTAVADEALAEATTAYITLQGLTGGLNVATCPGCGGGLPGELGNRTLAPGIYTSAPGSYGITVGDLTLDAKGDPNAYWVFQMATTLTVGQAAVPRNVLLVNGAKASNIFWAVGSDVTHLNQSGGGTFAGTVISNGAVGIAVSTVGNTTITTINGRLFSLGASTTLVDTVIYLP